jgi:hypothetical protein
LLPSAQRAAVDRIRERLDPKQHALIPAHVTLCRDDELVPWDAIRQRLDGLAPVALAMRFGEPQALADGGILLRATHGMEAYRMLRRAVLGGTAREHGAHITLLHPRNAPSTEPDWTTIAQGVCGLAVVFRTVSFVEQQGDEPWRVRRDYA